MNMDNDNYTAIKIQIKEIDDYLSSVEEEGRDASISEIYYAMTLQREELDKHLSIINEHRLCQAVNQSNDSDEVIDTDKECDTDGDIDTDEEMDLDCDPRTDDESEIEVKRVECVACEVEKSCDIVITTSCSHKYCQVCLRKLFENSLINESLFPPRCCNQSISFTAAQAILDPSIIEKAREKYIEFGTVDRTYCSRPSCSIFIRPDEIKAKDVVCTKCGQATCTRCKQQASSSECCTTRDQEFVALAEELGWQQCPKCSMFVELTFGCHHMTCRCGAEFCYRCGKAWRTCTCGDEEDQDQDEGEGGNGGGNGGEDGGEDEGEDEEEFSEGDGEEDEGIDY